MRRLLVRAAGLAAALALLAGAAAAALHLHHRRALDLDAMEAALEAEAARTRELARRFEAWDPDAALRALAPPEDRATLVRLDDRLASARVAPPLPASPAPLRPAVAFEFEGDDPIALAPRTSEHRVSDGMLHVDYREGDVLVTGPGLRAGDEPLAEIALRLRLARGAGFRLGWSRHALDALPEDPDDVNWLDVDAVPGGGFHVYRIDASHGLRVPRDKVIQTLFLEASDRDDRVDLDWLRVVTQRERYTTPPVGLGHESRGRELRPVLWAAAPREIVFPVRVPGGPPDAAAPGPHAGTPAPVPVRLDVGLGVLDAAHPVRVRIEARAAEGSGPGAGPFVVERSLDDPSTWHDVRLDLTPLAGRRARVRFAVEGEPGGVAFLASPRIGIPPRESERLNVLVVVEDTLRADHLSAWGHTRATSPFKDELARSGVVFLNARSQATKTRPSVPSYLTSLYPSTTGVYAFQHRLDPGFVTLAEVLRARGFETASFVQNTNAGPAAGVHQGFDSVRGQALMGVRPEQIYAEPVLDWIAARRDRNWLVYLHVLDPHGTYDPPPPFDAWYRAEAGSGRPVERNPYLDPGWLETPTATSRRLLYDGEIAHNDATFEAFWKNLRELGADADTLLVFFSDHGEHQGEHGVWEHRPPGFLPVLHVPLLMRHPTALPRGLRVDPPVALLDVMPTILELAGVDRDALPLQGRSLLPLMRGHGGARPVVISEEAIAYERDHPERVRGSVFHGRHHFLYSRHRGDKHLRVFDLAADPGETRPALPWLRWDPFLERSVLAAMGEVKAADLALWRVLAHGEEDVALDPESREQLRALGYIE